MKIVYSLMLTLGLGLMATAPLTAQDEAGSLSILHLLDSLEKAWKWQTGTVALGDNLASMNVPTGWRYLPGDQAQFILSDLWGNPPSESLGMLFPENLGPLDSASVAFNITFDELGFVKDDDAADINYDELLGNMQKETVEGNMERTRQGYEAILLVGWASSPYYDKDKKALHWAKELRFGDESQPHTLNYDVRLLGRKGVLSMNAIAGMDGLSTVKGAVPNLLNNVSFTDGNKYSDFDPKIDEVAAWTIGGLVAGKVLAKVGFFAIILKFLKPILLLVLGGGAAIWRWISGRRKEEEEPTPPTEETA
ncbi:MAG: DUF2167 domain-containing protein [Saprospiraceae bacterium]|nr:DUF2167 domain-containing protein [Saprospiraceae bacterium]